MRKKRGNKATATNDYWVSGLFGAPGGKYTGGKIRNYLFGKGINNEFIKNINRETKTISVLTPPGLIDLFIN